MEFDELSNRVIGCAIEVHRQLGPGLLESTYEQCLAYELTRQGINFQFATGIASAIQRNTARLWIPN
jgi:GxxExxY protein